MALLREPLFRADIQIWFIWKVNRQVQECPAMKNSFDDNFKAFGFLPSQTLSTHNKVFENC